MFSGSDIKRQILMESDKSGVRGRIKDKLKHGGITEGEIIEIGQELEKLTQTKGWSFVEAYMLRSINITGLLFGDDQANPDGKGVAKGYVMLMQYIQTMVKAKNEILNKDNSKENTDE